MMSLKGPFVAILFKVLELKDSLPYNSTIAPLANWFVVFVGQVKIEQCGFKIHIDLADLFRSYYI